MAKYRQIQTCFWDDSLIDDMDFTDKYFYLYLLTNPNVKQCGCYELSISQMTYKTSLPKEKIKELIKKFEHEYKIIKYSYVTKEILLLNFYKYNWTFSPKVKSCVLSELQEIKEEKFKQFITEKINEKYDKNNSLSIDFDSLSIDSGEKEKEKEKEKEGVCINTTNYSSDVLMSPPTTTHAHTPTLDELRSFCVESNLVGFDYDGFYNYYESNGWTNKNGTVIKNWRAKVRYWYNEDVKSGKIKKIDTSRRLG